MGKESIYTILASEQTTSQLQPCTHHVPATTLYDRPPAFLHEEGGASSLGEIALSRGIDARVRQLDTEQSGSRLRPLLTSFANKLTSAILAQSGLGGMLRARPSDHVLDLVADEVVWLTAWWDWFTQRPEGGVRRADPVETSRYDGVSAITAVFLMLDCLKRLSGTHPEP